jgi:hypothetical protein
MTKTDELSATSGKIIIKESQETMMIDEIIIITRTRMRPLTDDDGMVDCVVGAKMTLYANCSEEEKLLVAVDSAVAASSGVVHILETFQSSSAPQLRAEVSVAVAGCRTG